MKPDNMAKAKKGKSDNDLEKQKSLLKQYLGQYYSAKMKKKQLETRLRNFRANMGGIRGMEYSPVPRSQTNKVGDGAASEVIRAMEIEERIKQQQAEMNTAMLNVMKLMDYLPVDSTERLMLEYRHIDCLGWKQVAKETSYSRQSCINYYNAGIEKLLTFKKVQKMITDFSTSKEGEQPMKLLDSWLGGGRIVLQFKGFQGL